MIYRKNIWFFTFPLILFLNGCAKESVRYQEGSESNSLAQNIKGYVLVGQGRDAALPDEPQIVLISLPECEKKVLMRDVHVHSISGPSKNGIIAYIEISRKQMSLIDRLLYLLPRDDWWESLKTCDMQGKVLETCYTKSVRSIGDITKNIAISPNGRYVVCVTSGLLTIWDVNSGGTFTTQVPAEDDVLSWFPDSDEILFTQLHSRNEIPDGNSLPAPPYGYWHSDKDKLLKYPVASVYNVKTQEVRMLLPGIHVRLSPDGKSALLFNGDIWLLVNVNDATSRQIQGPLGYQDDPPILLNNQMCLLAGLPAKGTNPRWTIFGSFRAGMLMKSLKIVRLNTPEVETIVPYFDPRDHISFGTMEQN
jgi:hypothetical protein